MVAKHINTSYRYATLLYDKLTELSKLEPAANLAEFGYPVNDPKPVRVFRGYVYLQASAEVGLSRSSHGTAMAILNALRCVTNLKAGGPRVESVYILNYRLTEEQYREYRNTKSAASRHIAPSRYDTIINELTDLRTKFKALDRRVKELEGNNDR